MKTFLRFSTVLILSIFFINFVNAQWFQIGSDIEGEAAGDKSGYSVSLSSDGLVIAIGAPYNYGNGTNAGHVRVYRNISGVWTQVGNDIDGEAADDYSGWSISLSSDGSVVAIGAPYNYGNNSTMPGHVRVYENISGVWTQIGSDIDGEAYQDFSGCSVSLSSDGTVIAIGAYGNDGYPIGINKGHVRIYKNISGNWIQIGSDIDGEAPGDNFGGSVSLSSDGSIVAIGARFNDGNGTNSGHVRVYRNISGVWTKIGSDIDGEAASDYSGVSVSLNSNGSVVAIGAYGNDANGNSAGHVRVYKNISGVWTQTGNDIDGEAAGHGLGSSVSLSSDGSIVAISAVWGTNGLGAGYVQVYKNISGIWTQKGGNIVGEGEFDYFGSSVSLSSNGSVVGIGGPNNGGNGTEAGHVRVYYGFGLSDIEYTNTINGEVVLDYDCIKDGTEQGLEEIILKTEPWGFYGITDSTGTYTIYTDSGTFEVEQIIPLSNSLLIDPLCPIPNYHTVYFDSLGMDTINIDFFNAGIACPYLTIDINSDRRRRCFTNNTYVHYCNDGFADAYGVEVHVLLPDYVIFVSANYPYSIDTSGVYIFDIGNLDQGDCGEIHIIDSVACINGITGLTQCTEAWITPPNDCVNQLDTASYNQWDHSSVMVEGECMSDTIVRFIITNTGTLGSGDMQQPSEYRIFEDGLLVYTGTFQLLGGETLVIDITANGMTYRLEADQHPMHPGNSHPNETIESCGSPNISMGFVDVFSMDDDDADVEIDCMDIRDSYDPNDKSVSPIGITNNNYIMPGTELDYVIRFQNTGSDTAFTVIVTDTLSELLDVSTFHAGISSHPYILDVKGQGRPILLFQFFNINLPDSMIDETNSHGFVKFKISPYDSLSNNTIIENKANIFFDYNIPVITNTTFVTISDAVLIGNPIVIYGINEDPHLIDVKIYPNPTTGIINIIAEEIEKVEVLNIEGRRVFSGKENEIDLSHQSKGIYIIKVTTAIGVTVEKIVLE